MELNNPLHPVRPRSKERRAEMQGILSLTEPGARNHADAGRVEELQRVELVCGAAFCCGSFDGFGGEGDCWEEVHCALVVSERYTLQGVGGT